MAGWGEDVYSNRTENEKTASCSSKTKHNKQKIRKPNTRDWSSVQQIKGLLSTRREKTIYTFVWCSKLLLEAETIMIIIRTTDEEAKAETSLVVKGHINLKKAGTETTQLCVCRRGGRKNMTNKDLTGPGDGWEWANKSNEQLQVYATVWSLGDQKCVILQNKNKNKTEQENKKGALSWT